MPPMRAARAMASAELARAHDQGEAEISCEIKTKPAVQRCSHSNELVKGLKVLRPLRFFVSAAQLLIITHE